MEESHALKCARATPLDLTALEDYTGISGRVVFTLLLLAILLLASENQFIDSWYIGKEGSMAPYLLVILGFLLLLDIDNC